MWELHGRYVSEQMDGSGCPGGQGPWLEKQVRQSLVDEYGPHPVLLSLGPKGWASPERMKVPLSLPTTCHWGLRDACLLERSETGDSYGTCRMKLSSRSWRASQARRSCRSASWA